jgi:hypothetical protein
MNEKIRQLAEQFKMNFSINGHPNDGIHWDNVDEFAELIIKECAQACLAATEPGSSVHLVSVAYADAVRRHFGVEE